VFPEAALSADLSAPPLILLHAGTSMRPTRRDKVAVMASRCRVR
jgi:hypothetical protein